MTAPATTPRKPVARVLSLPRGGWQDPLSLTQEEGPDPRYRIVLWAVCVLLLISLAWAFLGKLDIVTSAEGKLVPQTLVKIVQPAESGVVRALLVTEGEHVQAGQVLARLDPTLAGADKAGVASDLARQQLQERRVRAQLDGRPMLTMPGDDPELFAQVRSQHDAHQQAYIDSLSREQILLARAEHERHGARQLLAKLEQSVPVYQRSAEAYRKLGDEGFFSPLASADKQREATEKARDLEAQRAAVAAADAAVDAQQRRVAQLRSGTRSDMEKELAEIRSRIGQLKPNLDKSLYREGLLELRAPQAGVIKDVASTTEGAVVQPGSVLMTLVPAGEELFADVAIRNEDIGFVQAGQTAQIKLLAFPFQKHGLLRGEVVRVSPDATDPERNRPDPQQGAYRARVRLNAQQLVDPQGKVLTLASGMQVTAEIHQGQRTVMQYLLSPVQKAVHEAARER